MNQVLIAVIGMALLGCFWGVVLVIVNKRFHVEENPVTSNVVGCLPGVNCGACGFAGCGAFGEAIVEKDVDPTLCPVCEPDNIQEIGTIIGKEIESPGIKQVAKLHCSGKKGVVASTSNYHGASTCAAEHITNGGSKACQHGCLGLADCVRICPFNAIEMGKDGLPIVDENKCTSCNKCVDDCPRKLFKLIPIDQKVFVLCSSHDSGVISRKACKVACIGCSICARKVENGTFVMNNFLAEVDYEKSKEADPAQLKEAAEKCPQKIISFQ
jgi:Na+-translocating ferredoxin:NAD+ oxidoreductase subunit B